MKKAFLDNLKKLGTFKYGVIQVNLSIFVNNGCFSKNLHFFISITFISISSLIFGEKLNIRAKHIKHTASLKYVEHQKICIDFNEIKYSLISCLKFIYDLLNL